jgi:hypothetical protein
MGVQYAIYKWDFSCFFTFHKFWLPTIYVVGALVAIANGTVVQYVWCAILMCSLLLAHTFNQGYSILSGLVKSIGHGG